MSDSGSLLVIGADGLLGGRLLSLARSEGLPAHGTTLAPPEPDSRDLSQLDLTQPLGDWHPPSGTGAAVLCAAITSLDACRRDPAATRQINVLQTLALARRLAEAGVFVTFISSNLVFDGTRPRSAADSPTNPQTEYGRQKAEVEAGLRGLLPDRAAIVRLTKVIHPVWPLIHGWIERLRTGQTVQAFGDFVCAPIPLANVARGLTDVSRGRRAGLWQFSAETDLSYADIARHLARRLGASEMWVEAVASRDRVALEHNPAHTTLDATRAGRELGLTFPTALDAIEQTFLA